MERTDTKLIAYTRGMKYQIREDYDCYTGILGVSFSHDFFELFEDGWLQVYAGYAWDGASGPTIDTDDSMRASLVHDVLCQAMRLGLLPYEHQQRMNELFKEQLHEDRMPKWRASYWHWAVTKADAGNPDQGPDRPIQYSPRFRLAV